MNNNMKQVIVSTRDLAIMVKWDGFTADQIAEKLTKESGVHINGEDVVSLIRERGIQQKNIKRSSNYTFVNPDEISLETADSSNLLLVAAVAEAEEPHNVVHTME